MTIQHYAVHGSTHSEHRVRFDKASGTWQVQHKLGHDRWRVLSSHDTRDDARARLFAIVGAEMRGGTDADAGGIS